MNRSRSRNVWPVYSSRSFSLHRPTVSCSLFWRSRTILVPLSGQNLPSIHKFKLSIELCILFPRLSWFHSLHQPRGTLLKHRVVIVIFSHHLAQTEVELACSLQGQFLRSRNRPLKKLSGPDNAGPERRCRSVLGSQAIPYQIIQRRRNLIEPDKPVLSLSSRVVRVSARP